MTPLHYLLLATHVPADGRGGGMIRYVLELARELEARSDIELHLLVSREARDLAVDLLGDESRAHVSLPSPTAVRSFGERVALSAPVLRREFDVVHGAKHLVPKRSRATRVLTVHDMILLDRPDDFGRLKKALLPGPYLASVHDADVILCVSEATRERLAAYTPSALRRTTVVPLAPATALLSAEPAPVARLSGRRFAGVVGDTSPRKNLALVVQRWAEIAGDADVRLAVVGPPGWGTGGVGDGPLDPRVELLGHVSDAELRWCYENADLVLCPSLAEGFGLPAAEAAAFGAPLLTSHDAALREAADGWGTSMTTDDPDAFVAAARELLQAERSPRPLASRVHRTWADVADETVRAVRAGREHA